MESKKKSIHTVATVVVVMVAFMIATLADSATIATENVAAGVLVDGGSHAFPRKNVVKNGENGVCLVKGKACKSHKDCPSDCACYTAGHCGDWVL
ncbi:hypothetical protein Csa_014543 [Cucumis sativus]|uniref:Uncharacterized protein n=1 Tax=Cucumis sativus TaxID=3659 RepID=A0A0A0KT53_CUCSA|nr:hypothetical protein Csa_014543 [Cucumis sativus]